MARRKKPRKIKHVNKYMRERNDADYINKLDSVTFRWFRKFIEELYGRKFTNQPIHSKEQRKQIQKSDYAAEADFYNLSVRVSVEPDWLDEGKGTDVQQVFPKRSIIYEAEIEREYVENGVKITRYKTVKK